MHGKKRRSPNQARSGSTASGPNPGGQVGKKVKALFFGSAVIAVFLSSQSFGQEPVSQKSRQLRTPDRAAIYDDSQQDPDRDLEMLKRDLRSQEKQIVATNMSFTDAEAEKFWPVYDRYAADLAKVYDTKIALIEEYLNNYKTMSGDEAESYIRRRAAAEEDVMRLRLKFVPEFRKVVSGRQAALFFQIEWRLDLMINLQLAQTPLIDP
jgi:hypothetical protein